MEIKRDYYLKKLISAEGNGLVKVITGIRRSGKSYLLNQIFKSYLIDERGITESHIIQVSFESYINDDLKTPKALGDYIHGKIIDQDKYFILLDEIQEVPNFESVLSDLLMLPNAEIYVSGSNSKFLSTDIITEFRGRSFEIRVFPLSFAEFYSAYSGGDKLDAWRDYWTYGGLPLVLLQNSPENKMYYLASLKDEIYLKDIIDRHNIKYPENLEITLEIAASMVGSLTNPLNLANSFKSKKPTSKISDKTIYNYLSHFEEAFLLEKAKRYNIRGRALIDTPHKYYFTDNGLRNAITEFNQLNEATLLENIVYTELRRRGYSVNIGVLDFREGNLRRSLEVDFVANKVNERVYVQVSLDINNPDTLARELKPFSDIDDAFKKILIVGNNITPHYEENGVQIINILDFLLG